MGSFFRMVKMDSYRMARMKMLWAVFFIAAAMTAAVVLRYALQINDIKESPLPIDQLYDKYSHLTVNAAINGEKIPIIQLVGISFSPLILVICSGIFIPFFINDEIHYGFLRNICGLAGNRGIIAAAKLYSITVYSVLSIAVIMAVSCICSKLLLGYVYAGGNAKDDFKTLGLLIVLIIAVNFLITAVSFLCGSVNSVAITAIFLFSGMQSVFAIIINMILEMKNQGILFAAGLILIAVFAAISILTISKRDVK